MSARTLWMQVSRSPCALPRQPCYSPEYSLISCIWHLPQASSDQVCTGKMAAGDCSAVGQPLSICVALGQLPHLRQSSKAGAQTPFEPIHDSPTDVGRDSPCRSRITGTHQHNGKAESSGDLSTSIDMKHIIHLFPKHQKYKSTSPIQVSGSQSELS